MSRPTSILSTLTFNSFSISLTTFSIASHCGLVPLGSLKKIKGVYFFRDDKKGSLTSPYAKVARSTNANIATFVIMVTEKDPVFYVLTHNFAAIQLNLDTSTNISHHTGVRFR
mmetsp:Transcript_83/g.118  ORF Transcript_83/g.118 Transcript_83/m.118 type:complete len:113 (+) Transcript_83:812-1150(+)